MYALLLWAAAFVWRTLLFRTTFIAITGSVGKTTAKECLAAILGSWQPTVATERSNNGRTGIPSTILRARPWHRFCVVEIGTDQPGGMIRGALLIRPDIALILSVAAIHTDNFKTLEDTAREKSRLLTFLGRHGIAVLNGSDPRVAAMARGLRCRVVWFGASPEFELWSSEASAQWPSRLAFRISTRDSSYQVKTQFVGLHWAGAVTGALAVAKACGVPLEQAVACIENVAPFPGRSQAAPLDNGAVILRDDYNGSYTTALASFEVMRNAKAKRRIAILSDCNDLKQSRPERVRHLADLACEFSDMLVFIGEDASHGVERALERGLAPENIHAFAKWEDAAAFLSENLGPGDLALLRSRRDGHLSRIYYALQGEVKCHLADCPLRMACDACPQLGFVPRSALSAPQRLAARVN